MKRPLGKIGAAFLAFVLATGAATRAQAQTASATSVSFSLSGDWSNTTNPNGPWSYNQGSTPLPLVPDWTAAGSALVGCSQPAWAPSDFSGNFLPALMNANSCSANNFLFGTDPNNGLANVMPGDIVTHTVDGSNGNPASGVANFLFTLPSGDDGQYEISGSVWDASFLFGTGRPQDWVLLVNGVQVASGFLSGIVSRSQAETFDVFADLTAGNTVDLELFEDPSSPFGFFVGANMNITEVTPPPTPTCPLSQGFWKNHGSQWPVTSLTLGGRVYTQSQLLTILQMQPLGDASVILADQLISTKLDIANGSDPAPVSAAVAAGDSELAAVGPLPAGIKTNAATGQAMTATAATLDSYNNDQLTQTCTAFKPSGPASP
ncbi:MAG: hypothetical protein DMG43_11250 [Acidobacteria bacterium]|nr:MAG: hypothetical protein DMG43_11250 [Acidobacteriota bacterium]